MNAQRTVRVSGLKAGQQLDCDIVGPDGVLLLASGRRVEETLLQRLRQRGIDEVMLDGERALDGTPAGATDAAASAPVTAAPAPAAAADVTPTQEPHVPLPPEAYEPRPDTPPLPRLGERAFGEAAGAADSAMDASLARYDHLGSGFRSGRLCDGDTAVELLLGLRRVSDRDIDLMSLMVSLERPTLQPLMQHAVRHAVVAMRLARATGLGPDATLDAGLVALFCDIGMSEAAEELLNQPGRLSPTDWERVHRHCAASADLVEKIRGIRSIISHAVYQHHERPNGGGYPRGRSGTFLHPLARIAAVADVFTAVMEARPHRPARTGHHAVRAALEGVKAGRLDGAIVRALLREVSLFPVGTPLRLSDGRRGRVFRTDAQASDRPVVAFDDGQKPAKVELALAPALKVTGVDEDAGAADRAAA